MQNIKKSKVLFLDTNIWIYIEQDNSFEDLLKLSLKKQLTIAVSPALVEEFGARGKIEDRISIYKLLTHSSFKRHMPETYFQSEEIKEAIRKYKKEWLLSVPNRTEYRHLFYDFKRKNNGYWDKVRDGFLFEETSEDLRQNIEHFRARYQSKNIRKRVNEKQQPLDVDIPFKEVGGYYGDSIYAYWKCTSFDFIWRELNQYTSPYREWIDCDINIAKMLPKKSDFEDFWFNICNQSDLKSIFLQGLFIYHQAFSRYTQGNPGDVMLSTELLRNDYFLSADKNFVKIASFAERDSPFKIAKPILVERNNYLEKIAII